MLAGKEEVSSATGADNKGPGGHHGTAHVLEFHYDRDVTRVMLDDHDVTVIYEAVGGVGPIADLAAEAMKTRNIDL